MTKETVMVETTDFRNGMALLTGAVNVITTAGETGRYRIGCM